MFVVMWRGVEGVGVGGPAKIVFEGAQGGGKRLIRGPVVFSAFHRELE